jgi:hypothetical protein
MGGIMVQKLNTKKQILFALGILVLSKASFSHDYRMHSWLIPRGVEILQNEYPKIAKKLDITFMVGDAGVYWPDNYSTTPNWKCPSYGLLAGLVSYGAVMGAAYFPWGLWWLGAMVGAGAGAGLYWAVFGTGTENPFNLKDIKMGWDGYMWNQKLIGRKGKWGDEMKWASAEHYEGKIGGKIGVGVTAGILILPPPGLPIPAIPVVSLLASAGEKCEEYFNKSSEYYKKGNFRESMKWLGRASHLIQDVTDPCHTWSPWLVLPLPLPLDINILTASISYWKYFGYLAATLLNYELSQVRRLPYFDRAKKIGSKVDDKSIDSFLVDSGAIYKNDDGEVFKSVRDFVHYTVVRTDDMAMETWPSESSLFDSIIPFAQRIQAGFFYYWYIKNIEKPPEITLLTYTTDGDTFIPIPDISTPRIIVYENSVTIKGTIRDSLLHDCKMEGRTNYGNWKNFKYGTDFGINGDTFQYTTSLRPGVNRIEFRALNPAYQWHKGGPTPKAIIVIYDAWRIFVSIKSPDFDECFGITDTLPLEVHFTDKINKRIDYPCVRVFRNDSLVFEACDSFSTPVDSATISEYLSSLPEGTYMIKAEIVINSKCTTCEREGTW